MLAIAIIDGAGGHNSQVMPPMTSHWRSETVQGLVCVVQSMSGTYRLIGSQDHGESPAANGLLFTIPKIVIHVPVGIVRVLPIFG